MSSMGSQRQMSKQQMPLTNTNKLERLLMRMFEETDLVSFKMMADTLVAMADIRAAIPLFEMARHFSGTRKQVAAQAFMDLLCAHFDFSGYTCAAEKGKAITAPDEEFERAVTRYLALTAMMPQDTSKLIYYIEGADWLYCCETVDVIAKYGTTDKRLLLPLGNCLLIPEVSYNAATILYHHNFRDPALIPHIIWAIKYPDKIKEFECGPFGLLAAYGDLAVRPIVKEVYGLNQDIHQLNSGGNLNDWSGRLISLESQREPYAPPIHVLRNCRERLSQTLAAIVGPGAVEAVNTLLHVNNQLVPM